LQVVCWLNVAIGGGVTKAQTKTAGTDANHCESRFPRGRETRRNLSKPTEQQSGSKDESLEQKEILRLKPSEERKREMREDGIGHAG